MQGEAAAQLQAEQARLTEAGKEKAELASGFATIAQENGSLNQSLQQEKEAAAESKVQPSPCYEMTDCHYEIKGAKCSFMRLENSSSINAWIADLFFQFPFLCSGAAPGSREEGGDPGGAGG